MEDSTTESTCASVGKKIDSSVLGHATEMLTALWEIANNDSDTGTPSNTSPASPVLPYSGHNTGALPPHNQAADTRMKRKKRGKQQVTNSAHTTGTLSPMQGIANKGDGIRAPSNTSPAVSPPRSCILPRVMQEF